MGAPIFRVKKQDMASGESAILDPQGGGTLQPTSSRPMSERPIYERAALMMRRRDYDKAVKRMQEGSDGGGASEVGANKRQKKLGERTWLPGAVIAVAFSAVLHFSICEGVVAVSGGNIGSLWDVCVTDPRKDTLWSEAIWRGFVGGMGEAARVAMGGGLRRTMVMDLIVLAVVNKGLTTR